MYKTDEGGENARLWWLIGEMIGADEMFQPMEWMAMSLSSCSACLLRSAVTENVLSHVLLGWLAMDWLGFSPNCVC